MNSYEYEVKDIVTCYVTVDNKVYEVNKAYVVAYEDDTMTVVDATVFKLSKNHHVKPGTIGHYICYDKYGKVFDII